MISYKKCIYTAAACSLLMVGSPATEVKAAEGPTAPKRITSVAGVRPIAVNPDAKGPVSMPGHGLKPPTTDQHREKATPKFPTTDQHKGTITPKPAPKPLPIEPNSNGNVLAQDPQVVRPRGYILPKDYQWISIFGEAEAAPWQAACFLESVNPNLRLSVNARELVKSYWEEAQREGVRPDLAFAQALVETGFFRFGGDVHPDQNNFCGLGTVGGGAKGARFATPQLGARAHIQHLLAYTTQKHPSTPIIDPRYKMAHAIRLERGIVTTWYGLNGTWAMGHNYAEKIFTLQQKMLAFKPSDIKPLAAKEEAARAADKADIGTKASSNVVEGAKVTDRPVHRIAISPKTSREAVKGAKAPTNATPKPKTSRKPAKATIIFP